MMMNQFVIVGEFVEFVESANELYINVESTRRKEKIGFEVDKFRLIVDKYIAQDIKENAKANTLLGLKGRIVPSQYFSNQAELEVQNVVFLNRADD